VQIEWPCTYYANDSHHLPPHPSGFRPLARTLHYLLELLALELRIHPDYINLGGSKVATLCLAAYGKLHCSLPRRRDTILCAVFLLFLLMIKYDL
jgi:hypothetical protein